MTDTFKVGDKVEHEALGVGELTYGPFTNMFGNPSYLLRGEDGRERVANVGGLSIVPADPRREVVARAIYDSEPYGGDWTTVNGTSKSAYLAQADAILAALDAMETPADEPAPLKVGDKIRILEDRNNCANVRVGDVLDVRAAHGSWFQTNAPRAETPGARWAFEMADEGTGWERVTADTETIDGVTYDLNAKYRDAEGDVWRLRRVDGVVRATTSSLDRYPDLLSLTPEEVSAEYGTLTRI